MNELKKHIHDNANGLDYTLVNDHYLPNLTVAASAEHPTGRWGRLHKKYLKDPSGTTNCSCPVSWPATLPVWTNRQTNSLPSSSVRCRMQRA